MNADEKVWLEYQQRMTPRVVREPVQTQRPSVMLMLAAALIEGHKASDRVYDPPIEPCPGDVP